MKGYLITEQWTAFYKYTKNYIVSEKEKRRKIRDLGEKKVPTYFKNKFEDSNGSFKLTFKSEIDEKINFALKRDYSIFNETKENYRIENYNSIGQIEVFTIENSEYLIESEKTKNNNYYVYIYNYKHYKKWLTFLDGLLSNYCFGYLSGVKEDIVKDASKKNIYNIEELAENIENIFNHCLDFHNDTSFENIRHSTDRFTVFKYLPRIIFFWKQKKEDEVNESINNLFTLLEDLFISTSPIDFLQKRDFVNLWIKKTIDLTINNKQNKMFQWGYSPFMDKIFNLEDNIENLIPIDKITLKINAIGLNTALQKPQQAENNTTSKQVITNDDRMYLKSVFDYLHKNKTNDFLKIQIEAINNNKSIPINYNNKQYKIYSPSIVYLFSNQNLTVTNLETDEVIELDVKPYFKTFFNAYEDGENHFKENYDCSKDVFFGENHKAIVSEIMTAYCSTEHKKDFIGWQSIIHSNPFIITHNILKDYGFYSGILNKADEFILKHPNTFKDFDKNKKNSLNVEHQRTESNITLNQIALKYVYEDMQITRVNGNKIAKKYNYNSGDKLYQKFNFYYSRNNRISSENTIKKTTNKIKLIESVIPLLNIEKKNKAIDDVNTLKNKIGYED